MHGAKPPQTLPATCHKSRRGVGRGQAAADPAVGRPTEGLKLKENEIYSRSIKILKGLKEQP